MHARSDTVSPLVVKRGMMTFAEPAGIFSCCDFVFLSVDGCFVWQWQRLFASDNDSCASSLFLGNARCGVFPLSDFFFVTHGRKSAQNLTKHRGTAFLPSGTFSQLFSF